MDKGNGTVVTIADIELSAVDTDRFAYIEAIEGAGVDDPRYSEAFSNYDELSFVKMVKGEQIGLYRIEKERAGLPYTFPDGLQGTVQTRTDTDFRNLNALMVASLALSSAGVTEAVFTLRDQENVDHPLTPSQMVSVGMAATSHISNCYKIGWYIKYQVSQMTTIEEVKVKGLDIEQAWESAKTAMGL